MIEFSDNLKQALAEVSGALGGDADEEAWADPEIMAEMAIDASRLKTFGYPKEDEEMSKLVAENGYAAVLVEAAKHVSHG